MLSRKGEKRERLQHQPRKGGLQASQRQLRNQPGKSSGTMSVEHYCCMPVDMELWILSSTLSPDWYQPLLGGCSRHSYELNWGSG